MTARIGVCSPGTYSDASSPQFYKLSIDGNFPSEAVRTMRGLHRKLLKFNEVSTKLISREIANDQ